MLSQHCIADDAFNDSLAVPSVINNGCSHFLHVLFRSNKASTAEFILDMSFTFFKSGIILEVKYTSTKVDISKFFFFCHRINHDLKHYQTFIFPFFLML